MSDTWYYAQGDQRKGPVEASALKALVDAGVVQAETLVWREGMADWEPAFRHVPGLAPSLPRAAGAPLPRAAPAYGAAAYDAGGRDYHETVGMGEAVKRFFSNYVNFSGRANRGEYWWAALGLILLNIPLILIDLTVLNGGNTGFTPLSNLFSLAIFLPALAIAVRRLHDIDRSGWWYLIILVPVVGIILILVWFCQRGTSGPNRFG